MKIHYFERAVRKLCIAKLTDCPEDNSMESIAIFEKGGEVYAVQSYEKEAIDKCFELVEENPKKEVAKRVVPGGVFVWSGEKAIKGKRLARHEHENSLIAPSDLFVLRFWAIDGSKDGVDYAWINVDYESEMVRKYDVILKYPGMNGMPHPHRLNFAKIPHTNNERIIENGFMPC